MTIRPELKYEIRRNAQTSPIFATHPRGIGHQLTVVIVRIVFTSSNVWKKRRLDQRLLSFLVAGLSMLGIVTCHRLDANIVVTAGRARVTRPQARIRGEMVEANSERVLRTGSELVDASVEAGRCDQSARGLVRQAHAFRQSQHSRRKAASFCIS